MAQITGYPVSTLVGMAATELLEPDDALAGVVLTPESLQIKDDDTRQSVRRLRHAEGHAVWVQTHVALVRDEAGDPVYLVSQLEDITGRRLIEEQLRERAHLLDLTQDAVVVRDLDGRVSVWHPAAERSYGWPAPVAGGHDLGRRRQVDPAADRRGLPGRPRPPGPGRGAGTAPGRARGPPAGPPGAGSRC